MKYHLIEYMSTHHCDYTNQCQVYKDYLEWLMIDDNISIIFIPFIYNINKSLLDVVIK